ncbi:MAG: spore coat protein, partial [Spirochaetaceae bacterium]
AEAGANCAKFQTIFADEIVPPNVGHVPLPGGSIPLYERFIELQQPPTFYAELQNLCERYGIAFLSSPFGIKSARLLKQLGVKAIKIASPELNHLPLLQEVNSYGLPIMLSTGVSRLQDIENALEVLSGLPEKANTNSNSIFDNLPPISLLHCVTAYPAPEEDYNLKVIPLLSQLFGVACGVSDHSLDPVLVPGLASAMGATIIEKHITLSRQGDGLDDPVALEPKQFASMVKAIKTASAQSLEQTIKDYSREFGQSRVLAVLGSGQKTLAASEAENYGRTNRSLHALKDLPAGHMLAASDFAPLRTEKVLSCGISPWYTDTIIGKKLFKAITAGQGIRWEDLLHG